MRIGIGMDTGGTYTDAVAYDFDAHAIVGSAKALTTRDDLSRGILQALDALPRDAVSAAQWMSLSTTLATNACVEGKGGRAQLIFFGGHADTIDRYGGKYGLPPSDALIIPAWKPQPEEDGGDRAVDWDAFDAAIEAALPGLDGLGIVEMDARKTGAACEKEARRRILAHANTPAVCGHELSMALNSFQRGASTLLNARLFPVIREFLDAINAAMAARGLTMPVVIVRSDGSLMSEAFTSLRPVETLLCGPAASVMGAFGLTSETKSIIVDMGGTTTDIAMVVDGHPLQAEDGIRVGAWRTCVNGLYINTVGLGGDSAIRYSEDRLILEPNRVLPVCALAMRYPSVRETLHALVTSEKKHTRPLYEHYVLVKPVAPDDARYTEKEKAFCQALSQGPLSLEAAAAAAGTDIYNLDLSRLLQAGVVLKSGLTPTDIMHILGDFSRYDTEAAKLAAQYVAWNLDISLEALCLQVYDEVKRKLYASILRVLLEQQDDHFRQHGLHADIERLIDTQYRHAKEDAHPPFLSMPFQTEYALVGIGAPIHIFLPDVARMLGTRAVIPAHAEVANALGAVMGNVYATCAVEIKPDLNAEGVKGYRLSGGNFHFDTLEEAVQSATRQARDGALAEAIRRGAAGDIAVTHEVVDHNAAAKENIIHLGTMVQAQATGVIGLAGPGA